eukprot:7379395-Prymnesium_polylepis.1
MSPAPPAAPGSSRVPDRPHRARSRARSAQRRDRPPPVASRPPYCSLDGACSREAPGPAPRQPRQPAGARAG